MDSFLLPTYDLTLTIHRLGPSLFLPCCSEVTWAIWSERSVQFPYTRKTLPSVVRLEPTVYGLQIQDWATVDQRSLTPNYHWLWDQFWIFYDCLSAFCSRAISLKLHFLITRWASATKSVNCPPDMLSLFIPNQWNHTSQSGPPEAWWVEPILITWLSQTEQSSMVICYWWPGI